MEESLAFPTATQTHSISNYSDLQISRTITKFAFFFSLVRHLAKFIFLQFY